VTLERHHILFIGSKKLGLECLQAMLNIAPEKICGVLTFDDRKDGRSVFNSFEKLCTHQGIKLHIAENQIHSEQIIQSVKPDMCFVIGWYWLIGISCLHSVPGGFIGLHTSLLPKYRGGAPLVWSLINGEPIVGATFFTLKDGIDNGPVWGQVSVKTTRQDDIGTVLENIEKLSINYLQNKFLPIVKVVLPQKVGPLL